MKLITCISYLTGILSSIFLFEDYCLLHLQDW
jgi:hypothetical protein